MLSEDDVIIKESYIQGCLRVLKEQENCIASSGQIIYLRENETPEEAEKRYMAEAPMERVFNKFSLGVIPNKPFPGEQKVPYSHAVILIDKNRFENVYPEDLHDELKRFNAFREESVLQLYNQKKGHITISPNFLVYHMNKKDVKVGGQRVGVFTQFIGKVINTYKFMDFIKKNGMDSIIHLNKRVHIIIYTIFILNEYIAKLMRRIK